MRNCIRWRTLRIGKIIIESYKEYTEEHIRLSQAYAVATIQNQGKYTPNESGDNNE